MEGHLIGNFQLIPEAESGQTEREKWLFGRVSTS
jgi:hypothetical protein